MSGGVSIPLVEEVERDSGREEVFGSDSRRCDAATYQKSDMCLESECAKNRQRKRLVCELSAKYGWS